MIWILSFWSRCFRQRAWPSLSAASWDEKEIEATPPRPDWRSRRKAMPLPRRMPLPSRGSTWPRSGKIFLLLLLRQSSGKRGKNKERKKKRCVRDQTCWKYFLLMLWNVKDWKEKRIWLFCRLNPEPSLLVRVLVALSKPVLGTTFFEKRIRFEGKCDPTTRELFSCF